MLRIHLRGPHRLDELIDETINAHLGNRGMTMRWGTIIDPTWIAAPSSRKKQSGEAGSGGVPDQAGKPVVPPLRGRLRLRPVRLLLAVGTYPGKGENPFQMT
jgi:hypothetical protein